MAPADGDFLGERSLRVLVVDDSSFMRTALRKIIECDPLMKVVGEAASGEDALTMVRTLRPHVVTMDIEMPGMGGIAAAKAIVSEFQGRLPVVIVSGQSASGSDRTVEALRCGANDFVSKASTLVNLDLGHLGTQLLPKLRYWAFSAAEKGPFLRNGSGSGSGSGTDEPSAPVRRMAQPSGVVDLVVIGVSTGGPATLPRLLRAMGEVSVPVVVAQHMPPDFTRSLAENLAYELDQTVVEGAIGQDALPNVITVLPGGRDTALRRSLHVAGAFTVRTASSASSVHPCIDSLFESATVCAKVPVAVVLTGMGADGSGGAATFHDRGLPVMVQDPATAIVPGMPEAVIAAGHATHILAVEEIGLRLARWTRDPRSINAPTDSHNEVIR